jgi:hypothetical protein
VENYLPMDRLVIYSVAAFINCALFGQLHLIKTSDRRRGCSGSGGVFKNFILPPFTSLTLTLIYIMGNPCIKNLALRRNYQGELSVEQNEITNARF